MSQIARVFVFLNLVLSVGFLFAAATFLASTDSYKTQLESAQAEATSKQTEMQAVIDQLQQDLAGRDQQVSAANEQRSGLEQEGAQLKARLEEQAAQLATKDQQITGAQSNAENLQNQLNDASVRVGNLITDKEEAFNERVAAVRAKEEAVAAKQAAEQARQEALDEIERLSAQVAAQEEEIQNQKLKILYAQDNGFVFAGIEVQPKIDAQVINYDPSTALVQFNRGEKDGVKRGYTFDVVRGGSYIGRVRIDHVAQGSSGGTLTLTASGRRVQVGDLATTTLN